MSSRTHRPPRPPARPVSRPPTNPSRSPLLVVGGVIAIVLVALVVAIVAGAGGDDGDTGTTGDVAREDASGGALTAAAVPDDTPATVEGDALAPLADAGADPGVGAPMPTVTGTGMDGRPVTIPTPDRPTMIVYVAHWCPHCQAEVPVVQQWVDDGGLPAGVDLVAVSTAVDPRRPNHPPAAWLDAEGWTAPVLVDGDGSAANAAGVTAFPFFVAVDGDGTVVDRASGELSAGQLDAIAAGLAGGGGGHTE